MKGRALLVAGVVLVALGASGSFLYERGYVRLNYPSSRTYPVRGVDVSSHQGRIDWGRLTRETRIDFAFIKASEGARLRDRRFLANWAAADGHAARGAYHFFTFCSPGAAQARNFIAAMPSHGELPPAVDIEFSGNCRSWTSIEAIRTELRAFLRLLQDHDGREPILYVTRGSYDRIIRGHVEGYPLWVREVVFRPSREQFPTMQFWQYAGNGRAPGVRGLIDLNVFVGDRGPFERLIATAADGS